MKLRKYQGLFLISCRLLAMLISLPDLHSQEPYFHLSAEGYKHRSSVAESHIKSQLSQARRTVLHRIIKKSFAKDRQTFKLRVQLRVNSGMHRLSSIIVLVLWSRERLLRVSEKSSRLCARLEAFERTKLQEIPSEVSRVIANEIASTLSVAVSLDDIVECIMDSAFLLRPIDPAR